MRLLLMVIPLMLAFGPFTSPAGLVRKGNSLFSEERYGEALESYKEALKKTDNKPPVNYNIGNVLLKEGRLDEAVKAYTSGMAEGDKSIQAESLYNRGNALYMKKDFKGAADSYKESLKHNPGDEDAKINLEIALKKLKEKENRENRDNTRKEDKESGEDGKEKDNEGNEDSSGEDRPGGEDSASSEEDVEKTRQEDMTREEAERLLSNLADKMDLKNIPGMLKDSKSLKVEKDW